MINDIPNRSIRLNVSEQTLGQRRSAMEQRENPWAPVSPRPRKVSFALKTFAHFATSADKGAVRDKSLLEG